MPFRPDPISALWPSQRLGIAHALFIFKERGSVLIAEDEIVDFAARLQNFPYAERNVCLMN